MQVLRLETMSCAQVESTIRGEGCLDGHRILGAGRRQERLGNEGWEVAAMGRGSTTRDLIEVQQVRLILEPYGHRCTY